MRLQLILESGCNIAPTFVPKYMSSIRQKLSGFLWSTSNGSFLARAEEFRKFNMTRLNPWRILSRKSWILTFSLSKLTFTTGSINARKKKTVSREDQIKLCRCCGLLGSFQPETTGSRAEGKPIVQSSG